MKGRTSELSWTRDCVSNDLFFVCLFFPFYDFSDVDHFKCLDSVCYNIVSVFLWGFFGLFFGCEACMTLVPHPGMKPASPRIGG